MTRAKPADEDEFLLNRKSQLLGEKMEKYIVYPFYQASDLSVSPSVAFDACGMCRIDAAAEQFLQRMAARNLSGDGAFAIPEFLHNSNS